MAAPDDTYDPLTPVPAERRVFGARDAFSLWFSLGIGLLVLQAGALLTPGLSLGAALAAIVAGSVLGVLLLAAAGFVGADTGLSTIGSLRPALGARGAAIPAVLNAIQLTGWGAFEIIAMRDSADALAKQTFGVSNPLLWTILFGALATWLAVMGPVSFVRRFLRVWGLWLLLAGAGWLTWRLLAEYDLAALLARPGTGEMTFGAGVDLVVAMPLSWLPLIADYTRFGRTPGGMFRGSALGYLLANIWFMGLGAAYALASGGENLLLTALAASGGGVALLLIVIDETDNTFADIHSAAVSTATLIRRPPARLALGFGALCTLIALFAARSVRGLPADDRLGLRAAVRRAAGRPLHRPPSSGRADPAGRPPVRPCRLVRRHRRLSRVQPPHARHRGDAAQLRHRRCLVLDAASAAAPLKLGHGRVNIGP